MIKIISFLILITFLIHLESKAQNTLVLVNGKKIEIGEYKYGDTYLTYKNKKGKLKSSYLNDIFSVEEQNGKEKVFYIPDSTEANAFTIDQMRDFVNGTYDARTNYKTPWITTAGLIIGGGSAGLTAAGMSSLLVPVLPAFYSAGIGIIKVKKEKIDLPTNLKNNEYYLEGYVQRVNHKRTNHAILSSAAGIALGVAAVILFAK